MICWRGVSDFRGYIVAPCYGEHWCAGKYLKEDELSKELLSAEVVSARSVVKECNRLLAPLWRGNERACLARLRGLIMVLVNFCDFFKKVCK